MGKFVSRVVTDDNGDPLANAVGEIYDINDTGNVTPLAIFDISGTAFPLNELHANNDGITPEFDTQSTKVVVKWVSGTFEVMMLAYDLVPVGGSSGQVLTKNSATDYDLEWANVTGVPIGGTTGQVLMKSSAVDFATTWGPAVVNVKTLGALGNGVADDYAAIQAALDLGGGVYFPQGDYRISQTLQVKLDATSLIGEGAGNRIGATQVGVGTRIRPYTSFSGSSLLLVQRAANDRPLTHIHIADMSFDGNNVAGPIDGIIFRASQATIHHVSIWQCTGKGLRVQGYITPAWDTYDTMFHNMLIGYCGDSGVYLDNDGTDTHFSHVVMLENLDNFVLAGGGSVQVTGCHFYGANRHNIFFNGAGSRSKFANCKIEGAGNHGVNIDTTVAGYSDIQFTGCGFSSVDTLAATNTYDLVIIQGPSAAGAGRTLFSGCSFGLKGGLTIKPRFGINLSTSAAQGTVIVGNSFGTASQFGTAPINNGSNSSILPFIRNNANAPDYVLPNVKTASYTLTADDTLGFPVEMNSATAVTVTFPPNAQPGFVKGNVVEIVQTGAGQVTFAPGSGVTLRTPRSLTTRAQWSTVRARQTATNSWILDGDLT